MPQSSYRLGVKAANLHKLFPDYVTETLQHSISAFDKEVLTSLLLLLLTVPVCLYFILNVLIILINFCFLGIWNLQLPGFISKEALLHGVEVIPVTAFSVIFKLRDVT